MVYPICIHLSQYESSMNLMMMMMMMMMGSYHFLLLALEAMPNRMNIKVTRSSTLKIYLDPHIVHG